MSMTDEAYLDAPRRRARDDRDRTVGVGAPADQWAAASTPLLSGKRSGPVATTGAQVKGGRALLVANNGGHLTQLMALADRLPASELEWATVPTDQSESMLAGQTVHWMKPAATRDWRAATANAKILRKIIGRGDFDLAVSTGSSLAVSALPIARLFGVEAHYIESVTRTCGPSVSGRILASVPGVQTYTQWPLWSSDKWGHAGSVFDGFASSTEGVSEVSRVVVSLGTSATYGFERAVNRLLALIPAGVHVLWQTGCTNTDNLPIVGRDSVPNDEMIEAITNADVIIAHAGAGITVTVLECGKVPLLLPRRPELNEHVDDHQHQIAGVLEPMGLAVVRDAERVTWEDVVATARLRVTSHGAAPPLRLTTAMSYGEC